MGRIRRTLILAEARLKGVFGEDFDDRWEVVATFMGRALVGLRYTRPIDWLEYPEGEHEIVVAEDFVSSRTDRASFTCRRRSAPMIMPRDDETISPFFSRSTRRGDSRSRCPSSVANSSRMPTRS